MSNAQIAVINDQLDLIAWMDARPPRAFGETYCPTSDGLRIGEQGLAIFRCLADGQKWTLPQLGKYVDGMATSHSARIRNIRDWMEETGRGTIETSPGPSRGLYYYQMIRTWPIRGQHYAA